MLLGEVGASNELTSKDVVVAVFTLVLTLAVQGILRLITVYREMRTSELGGRWFSILDADPPKETRVEVMHIRQRGSEISGNIRRVAPRADKRKRWRLEGHVEGTVLVALFYPNGKREDASSYGLIELKRINFPKIKWVGAYRRGQPVVWESPVSEAGSQLGDSVAKGLGWQRDMPPMIQPKWYRLGYKTAPE